MFFVQTELSTHRIKMYLQQTLFTVLQKWTIQKLIQDGHTSRPMRVEQLCCEQNYDLYIFVFLKWNHNADLILWLVFNGQESAI